MKTIKLILVSLLFTSIGLSQGITIPKQYSLNTESDFDKYENIAMQCAEFILTTPFNQQSTLRGEASKFLIEYVSKSNSVKVELNQNATPFISNEDLLTVYIASWFRSYGLQNHANNKEEFTLRAANETLDFYKANKNHINKVKGIKKYLKLQADGKLENHIKSNL